MEATLKALRAFKYPKVSKGSAANVEEFFEAVIKPQYANRDAIKAQHRALMEYINLDLPTFFIRAYGSRSKSFYSLLRRGFLSQYSSGIEYAFCDNTFAMLFAAMKLAGVACSAEVIKNIFQSRQVVCGFGQTGPEKELAAFRRAGAFCAPLNTNGWYLAHIFSVGVGYANVDFATQREKFFPEGVREEWQNETRTRRVGRAPGEQELRLLKAHFIRLTHPLNNFLVPGRNYLRYNRGTRIGEEIELISFVSDYLRKNFKEEYAELENVVAASNLPEAFSDPISEIAWGSGLGSKTNATLDQESRLATSEVSAKPRSIPKKAKPDIEVHTEQTSPDSPVDTITLLRRMGSKAFLYYYLPLKSNPEIQVKTLATHCPGGEGWTEKAKAARAAVAKRIFREGRVKEALQLTAGQKMLPSDLRQMGERYYDDLLNEDPDG